MICPYCRESIATLQLAVCPACQTPHHGDCWQENGGCTVFGCSHAPADEPKISVGSNDLARPRVVATQNPARYLVYRKHEQFGPYTLAQVRLYSNDARLVPTDMVWTQGMTESMPLLRFLSIPRGPALPAPPRAGLSISTQTCVGAPYHPVFFYIPLWRLVAMCLLSCGLFEMYWAFHNWRFLKDRDKTQISPFGRAIVGIFYIHPLFSALAYDPDALRLSPVRFSGSMWATLWVLCHVASVVLPRISDHPHWSMIGLLGVGFLIPAQRYINTVNESASPRPQLSAWSTGQFVCLILGLFFWLLTALTWKR